MTTRFLRRREVVTYCRDRGLPIAEATLAKYATVGGGPVFHKFGKAALYDPAAVDEWIAARLGQPLRSTSDRAA